MNRLMQSVRKERKVRPGFTPSEDIARFRPSSLREKEGEAPSPRRRGVNWMDVAAHTTPRRPREEARTTPSKAAGPAPSARPSTSPKRTSSDIDALEHQMASLSMEGKKA